MKIGSGGLQSIIGHEIAPVKKSDFSKERTKDPAILDVGINAPNIKEGQLNKAVEEMNKTVDMLNRNLKFSMHDATDRVMIKVFQKDTGELLKEYPAEEFLDMMARLRETMGVFIDSYV